MENYLLPEGLEMYKTEEEMGEILNELAARIEEHYRGKTLLTVCMLQGGMFPHVWLMDRVRKLNNERLKLICERNPSNLENALQRNRIIIIDDSITISKYESGRSKKHQARLLKDMKHSPEECHVLVTDEVLDSGNTANFWLTILETRNPTSIAFSFIFQKKNGHTPLYDASKTKTFIGAEFPDEWFVGFGLDGKGYDSNRSIVNGLYRNLPYLAIQRKTFDK